MKYFFFLVLLILIVGCGIAHNIKTREDMESSKVAYTECLNRESDLSKCEGLKRAFEANLDVYRARSQRNNKTVIIEDD